LIYLTLKKENREREREKRRTISYTYISNK
jgi:hypothetical protein